MKKILSTIAFFAIVLILISYTSSVVLPKDRDYFIKDAFEDEKVPFDVLAFGSCHNYTSFNPVALWEEKGITSYNLSRPAESIAATYALMSEVLKNHAPKVVLIETWGLKADDTYLEQESVYGEYLISLMDTTGFSKEKLEVINEYEPTDILLDNFYIFRYKDRMVNNDLKDIDFKGVESNEYLARAEDWTHVESGNRVANKGFKANIYSGMTNDDFYKDKPSVDENEKMSLRADSQKYLDKIIDLCKSKGITPIFYRAPYADNKNEIMRDHYIEEYLTKQGIAYYDLEKEIDFDIDTEMVDNAHLNTKGAVKSTNFLIDKITSTADFINHKGDKKYISWENLKQKNFEIIDATNYRVDVDE